MLPVITLIIVLLLPLTIGVAYWNQWSEHKKKLILEHRAEVKEIKKLFYKAIRMQFLRTPLIVQTTKERAYYNKLIVHYKNSTRKIELIAPNLGEENTSYRNRIDAYLNKYCIDESEAIRQGQEAYTKYFEDIRNKGLLRYFKTPYKTEKSKEYIYHTIDFLIKNPKATYGNYKKPSNVVLFE